MIPHNTMRRSWYAPPRLVRPAVSCSNYRLLLVAAAVRSTAATVGLSAAAMRCVMACTRLCSTGVRRSSCVPGMRTVITARSLSSAFASTIGDAADSAVISSSAIIHEAMAAPTMAVAIACPWAHAHEDAIVEVARSVISYGCAGVRCIPVIAVRAGGLNINVNGDLCVRRRRHG